MQRLCQPVLTVYLKLNKYFYPIFSDILGACRRFDFARGGVRFVKNVFEIVGLGLKPPQKRPSVRSTSKEGTTFERNPMSLQP